MKRLSPFLLILIYLHAANVQAQDSRAGQAPAFEIPAGPLLHAAPDFAQWTTQYSYPDDTKKDGTDAAAAKNVPLPGNLANRPRTLVTTKTRDVIHMETTTVGGAVTDAWQIKGDCWVKYPGKALWTGYTASNPTEIVGKLRATLLLPASGFRDLTWLDKDAYAGRTKSEWGDCYVFLPGGHAANADISKGILDAAPIIAYVDAQTRLPVMVRNPDGMRVFKFVQPPPTSVLQIPDVLVGEIKETNAVQVQRNAAPSREY
ncbi:MAG TPA: hypothetical protein VIM71_06525 [Lacunisphaera sp.]